MSETAASEPHVIRNYFAQWRKPGRSWSKIHWFRDAVPACGVPEPDGEIEFDLPSEPILTCHTCQTINRKAMGHV